MGVSNVLVPVRGDTADEEAVRLACNLVKKKRGLIYVLYVIEVERQLPLDAELDLRIRKGETVLTYMEAIAKEEKYEVETELIQARETGPAIVDEARDRGVGLIVMGVPYKTPFGAFSLGDAAPYVLRNAPCAVWLYRERMPKEVLSKPR